MGDAAPTAVTPPGDDVTTYSVPAGFPKYDGAVKVTEASAFPAVAVPIVGVPGIRPPEDPEPFSFCDIYIILP
jgi:hypothetical protein